MHPFGRLSHPAGGVLETCWCYWDNDIVPNVIQLTWSGTKQEKMFVQNQKSKSQGLQSFAQLLAATDLQRLFWMAPTTTPSH